MVLKNKLRRRPGRRFFKSVGGGRVVVFPEAFFRQISVVAAVSGVFSDDLIFRYNVVSYIDIVNTSIFKFILKKIYD